MTKKSSLVWLTADVKTLGEASRGTFNETFYNCDMRYVRSVLNHIFSWQEMKVVATMLRNFFFYVAEKEAK